MEELDRLNNKFISTFDSIDESNKKCIQNLEKLIDNLKKELLGYNCSLDCLNEIITCGDKYNVNKN